MILDFDARLKSFICRFLLGDGRLGRSSRFEFEWNVSNVVGWSLTIFDVSLDGFHILAVLVTCDLHSLSMRPIGSRLILFLLRGINKGLLILLT